MTDHHLPAEPPRPPPLSSAERVRRHRMRQRDGKRVFHVELPEYAVADVLVESGRLTDAAAVDPALVGRALSELLADVLARMSATRYAVKRGGGDTNTT